MSPILYFVGRRLAALSIAVPLMGVSYFVFWGIMQLTQAPPILVIDITHGRKDVVAERLAEQAAQQARREQQLATLRQQLAVSYALDDERATKFAAWMQRAVEETGVPVQILAGVLATESTFRYRAESWAGAIGPAQVIPRYWGDLCTGNLYRPEDNIRCGARVLMHYHQRYCERRWRCTLSHYNVGPGNLASGDPAYQAAADRYFNKVVRNMNTLRF